MGAWREFCRGRDRETPGLKKLRCFAQPCYGYGGPRKSPRARVTSGGRGRTSQALFSTCDGSHTRPNASLAVRQGQDEEATDTLGYFPRPPEIGRPAMATTEVDVLVKVFWQKTLKNSSGSEIKTRKCRYASSVHKTCKRDTRSEPISRPSKTNDTTERRSSYVQKMSDHARAQKMAYPHTHAVHPASATLKKDHSKGFFEPLVC